MYTLQFQPADIQQHRNTIVDISVEYMTWVAAEMEAHFGVPTSGLFGMSIADYVASTLSKVCGDTPPHGVFYLVQWQDEIIGTVALRQIRNGVAEIKRVYVRPAYRGKQFGMACLHKIIADARHFGYQQVVLDSAPFMAAAQHLYQSLGFNRCAPYSESEVPTSLHARWCFMELDLNL